MKYKSKLAVFIAGTTLTLAISVPLSSRPKDHAKFAATSYKNPILDIIYSKIPEKPVEEVIEDTVEVEVMVNEYELKLLSKLLMEEAGAQPREGKIAILNVVQNRLEIKDATLEQIIFAKGQFSCVKSTVRNNNSLASRSNPHYNFYNESRQPNEECIELARLMLQGRLERIIPEDVYYYYNPNTAGDTWIKSKRVYKKIGDHVFAYK